MAKIKHIAIASRVDHTIVAMDRSKTNATFLEGF